MSTGTAINVIWMDGEEGEYSNVVTYHRADGVLTIEESPPSPVIRRGDPPLPSVRTTVHLVLANVRKYEVQERE
jgi:hypothetical protein